MSAATGRRLRQMPEPIEMVGHVVEPVLSAATGPRPLVFFLHGRHEPCYQATPGEPNGDWPCGGTMAEIPSHLGYDYVQRRLASQGYTTVSVRVNGINAQDFALDDGGAGARATIVRRHLELTVARGTTRPDRSRRFDRLSAPGVLRACRPCSGRALACRRAIRRVQPKSGGDGGVDRLGRTRTRSGDVDHPADAELVGQLAEGVTPGRRLQRHGDRRRPRTSLSQ